MARVPDEQILEYLYLQSILTPADQPSVQFETADAYQQRYYIVTAEGNYVFKLYEPVAFESARREAAGMRLGDTMNLSPALTLADEQGGPFEKPIVMYQLPAGDILGNRPLTPNEIRDWLFLLLMLHHLSPDAVTTTSSMSPDAATWWQRTQSSWDACRAAFAAPRYAQLLEALTRLHAIVGVHIETNRQLWNGLTRRPCHGNPVPSNLVNSNGRLLLIEWDGFGLGDPAMEVGRAAALTALSGELGAEQYVTFVSDYLNGTRDLRDATFEERIRVFASALPLGFAFAMLALLAQDPPASTEERERIIQQVARALRWIQDTLGIEISDAQALLAPLRG